MQPLPIPNQVWQDISMDLIEGLPKAGAGYCLGDGAQNYDVHFLVLCHPFTAKEVAALFVQQIVRLHGFP